MQDEVRAYRPGAKTSANFRARSADAWHVSEGLAACRDLAKLRSCVGGIVLGDVIPQVEQISVGPYRMEHLRYAA